MKPEFAPQYSPEERRRLLILYGVLSVLIFGALYLWITPRLRLLAIDAPCETLFGMPASTVLLYSLLVGGPLVGAVMLVATSARSSIHAIATRRYPPPGQKVFGRVIVKKGRQAVMLALVPAVFVTCLCLMSTQAMPIAEKLARDVQRSVDCDVASNDPPPSRTEGEQKPERRRSR